METNEVLQFMIEEFNKENVALCEKSGMTPDQIQSSMNQAQPSITYMIGNIYEKMKEKGYIA
jgi:hypothetical protein